MDDRTSLDLMRVLANDVERCNDQLEASLAAATRLEDGTVRVDYEFSARQLVRAVFAFIEAVTFSVKVRAPIHCLVNGPAICDAERYLAGDVSYKLESNGTISQQPAHIRLADNIRYTIALTEKAKGITDKFDPGKAEWWSCLQSSIKVRDRLTHPKMPEDIDVTTEEIVALLKAFHGFSNLWMAYPPYPLIRPEDLDKFECFDAL